MQININAPCRKCGSNDISHRYRAVNERIDQCVGDPFDKATEELIRSVCRTCGFKWSSKPKDSGV